MKLRDLFIVGTLVGGGIWLMGMLKKGLTLVPPTLPVTLSSTATLSFTVGIKNETAGPLGASINGWFAHTTDPLATHVRSLQPVTVPANSTFTQAVVFDLFEFQIPSWSLGNYRVVVELFAQPGDKKIASWTSPTVIQVG